MSNGIGPNPLNPLSKIYLECIAEKKDDTYLEPDMKKRQVNNEKARKELAKGPQMKNPHFEEVEVDEAMSSYDRNRKRAAERAAARNAARAAGKTGVVPGVGYVSPRKERETYVDSAGTTRHKSGAKMEGLDPVGKEDGDVNNDGKKDSTDSYLMKRRKAIGKAMKKKMSEGVRDLDPEKGTAERKARLEKKRGMKMDDHPQYKKEETEVDEYIDTVAKVKDQERKNDVQRWLQKESSNWRQDLSEIMTDDIDSKPIKEKKVNNKIKINPKLGEAVEEMGGELIEMTEISEFEFMVEGLRQELVDEGHDPEAVNYALEEATVTMGHDTPGKTERTRDKLKKKAKGLLGKMAYKGYHAARDAKRAASPMVQRIKTSAKRGMRKAALKVADKLKEENVDEAEKPYPYGKVGDKLRKVAGERDAEKDPKKRNKLASRLSKINREYNLPEAVYGGTPKKAEDKRMVVTNADKKGNTPAYQKMMAGDKRYKKADHMNEGDGDPCWDTHKQVGMKKKGGKMVPNCVPKEEVHSEEMSPQEVSLQKKKAMLDKMIANRRRQELDKGKAPTKAMGEEASDAMKDRRMERGGVGGNQRYDRAPKPANTAGKKKKYDGMSALDFVKADIRKKHGQGAIIDTKKK